ncbi:TrbG/VirB9 family P-type conjugative transfer protein (plasmid) [Lichenicola cladoniae]|uniref:TrbG/VirB9 family P-type conjugative transfer protein n=1 Tax=Lichenicola cladoniae TaxID=1484109 RepID=A0A6M8HZN5_9PROT|nr:TrbG/VirB9 family P-type conjugative transfer protein [Lichenicola cladoniae]NPD70336.1 TrbG/VirB9 family P-type conjugative transfer protein [Acetobacteraceae bacterium]QKE93993.1 TrbG/VirB9 family P-type conjugative transfer protein [Lichenicola cladoniae]
MRRSLVLATVASCALAGPALAVQTPHAGRYDSRVRVVAYNPMNVVRVIGGTFASTEIMFAPGESITQVAIGDADAWLAGPTGNLLFLKPTEVRAPTNAQVVTRRPDGSFRSYQFELVAHAGTVDEPAAGAQFAINFVYPDDARQEADEADRKRQSGADELVAQNRLAVDFYYGPRNWRYTAQGSTAIQPLEVSDNGRLTAFRFPGNMTLPTIYTVATDGQEGIVPYTMHGDLAVVSTTAREFRLRYGHDVLRVFDLAFNPIGQNPGTGTTDASVVRTVRGAGS